MNPSDMNIILRYKPKCRNIRGDVFINIQLKTKTERKGKQIYIKIEPYNKERL